MSKRYSVLVRELLLKAKSSALLAVEIFNKPTVEFRVQAFVMLMHVAWNSLLLSTFLRDNIRPYYKKRNGYNYCKVDGEPKTWELSHSILQYWKSEDSAIKKNLEFFISLRNKIEHYRDQAALIKLTFGECQSLVTNFEELLTVEFGQVNSLLEDLSLSLQLSTFRNVVRDEAILKAVDRSTRNILDFIADFRSSLDDDVYSDMRYSHKLFLLPRTTAHMSRDAIAIEWIDLDSLTQQEAEDVAKLLAIIRPREIGVRNKGNLTPGKVCERIRKELDLDTFSPSSHHVRCWKFFKVRPEGGAKNPSLCKTEYCQYDEAFNGYVYTEAWVNMLIRELGSPERLDEIMDFHNPVTVRG